MISAKKARKLAKLGVGYAPVRVVSGAAGPGGTFGYPAQVGITDGAAGPGGTVGPDQNFGDNSIPETQHFGFVRSVEE